MKVLCASILFAFPALAIDKASFRGMLENAPIWMDLELPKGDGKVTGSYQYLKYGKPIALQGGKTGSDLRLEEKSGGKVTGLFKVALAPLENEKVTQFSAFEKMSLSGTWNKPGKRKELSVWTYQVDPAYRSCALVSPDSLQLEGGKTFGDELDEHIEGENSNPEVEVKTVDRSYEISGCAGGFLSTYTSWVYTSAYHPTRIEMGSSRRVFDLAAKQEIRLSNEIDEKEKKRFATFMSKRLSDPGTESKEDSEPDRFPITEDSEFDFYLDHDNPMVGWSIDVPPEEGQGSGYETVENYVSVPFKELKKFLRKDSVLHRLGGRF